MKRLLVITVFFISSNFLVGQTDSKKNFLVNTIAFYNVENLFDTINDPKTWDDDRTPKGKDKWTSIIYKKKLNNIAKVIADIGFDLTNQAPSIIGLCEIENRRVLEDLIKTESLIKEDYQIIHYDSPDERGIDVAMLYKQNRFKLSSSKTYPLYLKRKDGSRDYTRDHLLVSGFLDKDPIHFIINHWPSRSGGQMRSEPSRILAGKVNKKIIDSILQSNPKANIISMGDFNDNPSDKSIKPILNTTFKKSKIKEGQLFNPMEELYRKGYGSYRYRDKWDMIDQFFLSKNLVDNKNGLFFLKASVFNKKYLINPSGKYEGYPFKSFAGGKFLNGYSDHFPIYLYLAKEY
jgi:predicted extracellular nuclease